VKVLAWTFIVSAIFMAVPGLFLLLFPGIMMMGHMFHPFIFAGPLLLLIALMFITIPAGIALTGVGLLNYRDWGRVVASIFAVFMLFFTAIGIYALWVLNSNEGSHSYKLRSSQATV
jgi:ABC-type multidrug transport system permease subunit